jgi:septal ring factor EnvC (AmiA/AmiB activator)
LEAERDLIDSAKAQTQAKGQLLKIKVLLRLQNLEKDLGKKRQAELESTIDELELRKTGLESRLDKRRGEVREFLKMLQLSWLERPKTLHLSQRDQDAPAERQLVANLVDYGVRDLEALRIDLQDSEQLTVRIHEEKQQLTYLINDLYEKQSILELNRELQISFLKRTHQQRLNQLEMYQRLKGSESQIERLLSDFSARRELWWAEWHPSLERHLIRSPNSWFLKRALKLMRGKICLFKPFLQEKWFTRERCQILGVS